MWHENKIKPIFILMPNYNDNIGHSNNLIWCIID